jgi:hypothetical protein
LAFDERSSRLRYVPFDALLRTRAAFLQTGLHRVVRLREKPRKRSTVRPNRTHGTAVLPSRSALLQYYGDGLG